MPSKSTKDSNAPKKALTAYMLFSADERPKLKASGLDDFAEMNKALGAAWKQANQEVRAHYEKEHEREKTRYDGELKNYEKSGEPAPSSASAQKSHPAPKSTTTATTKSSTATKSSSNESTSKKNVPAAKNPKHKSDDENDKEDDGDESEEEEEEEEEEEPTPPVKSSRKKN